MKSSIQIKKIAQEVVKIEQEQIKNLVDRIDEEKYSGFLYIHDIIKEGIVK